MSDPYVILGIKPNASDEEVKKAYRDMVKKYHPDNYQNNPLSGLAEEKMKEVNEAYDAIVKQRSSGQGYGGSYGGYQSSGSGQRTYGDDPLFQQVRQMIDVGRLNEAQRLLESGGARTAEWYYLMGSLSYRRGWLAEARDHFNMALRMEPGNMEYRQAVQYIDQQSGRGFQTYQQGGMSTSDCCMGALCLNCLCNGGCN
ncbi:MAG: Chaperone protein DnaJ [Firmicutes bacterium]|nr:Chaperone protein DnaJ [Bacillota bacterium]